VSVYLPSFSGTQIARFLRRIKFSPVACLVVPYFSTLSPKGTIFGEKNTANKMCFDIPYSIGMKHFSF